MHALQKLAGEHPWLTVIHEGLYVMPLVEGVPIRLYRGAPDRPGSRHLEAARLEHERSRTAESQMAFDFMADPAGGPWYWLMAMETGAEGRVCRVVFVQANDAGETRHAWECPPDELREERPPRPALQLVGAPPATRRPRPARPMAGHDGTPGRQEDLWSAALGAE
jgi:hypothetical protein